MYSVSTYLSSIPSLIWFRDPVTLFASSCYKEQDLRPCDVIQLEAKPIVSDIHLNLSELYIY